MSLLPVGIGNAGGEYTLDNSLRFRSSASAYLSWTPASDGNRQVCTISIWAKRGILGAEKVLFHAGTASTNRGHLRFNSDDTCEWAYYNGSWILWLKTNAVFRDPSAWYHIVGRVDTTSGAANLYVNGVDQSLSTSTKPSGSQNTSFSQAVQHQIGLRGYSGAGSYYDGYMTEINFIDGQALTADDFGEFDETTGVWKPKEYSGTYGTNGFYLPTTATTQAEGFNTVLYTGNGASQSIGDVGFSPDFVWIKKRSGAENHGLFDTVRGAGNFLVSNDTASEYARGNSITTFDADGFSLGNYSNTNVSGGTNVAWCWDAGANQTSTGISSVAYTGTGAARPVAGFGFSPDLVWIKSRSAASHILVDSVRGSGFELSSNSTAAETSNGVTRFKSIDSDGFTLANTTASSLNTANTKYIAWGWDAGDGDPVSNTQGDVTTTVKANDATGFSIATGTTISSYSNFPFTVGHGLSTAPSMVIYKSRGTAGQNWWVWHKDLPNAATGRALNLNSTSGEISGAYFDSNPSSSTTVGINSAALTNDDFVMYSFAEVSGVSKFGSYTGTGATGKVITTGFRPGFLLVKRTDTTSNWVLIDSTRQPFYETNRQLYPNLSDAEGTGSASVGFDSDGFTINNTVGNWNASGGTYIYMAFKGSYSDYVSPLNDTGTIDSRVKANPEKGFSIVSYEGDGGADSVGHGLSTAPEVVILKDRDNATYIWCVYHKDLTSGHYLRLDGTNASTLNATVFGDGSSGVAPDSTKFYIGGNAAVNTSGNNYIAYCFHSVAGYSKIDSYTGTGVAGLSVTTGFRPAFVMIKRTDVSGQNWNIVDGTRSVVDPRNLYLSANLSDVEKDLQTTASADFLNFTDTGFEVLNTGGYANASGGTYIYMAFADTRDAQFNFDASGNKNNWTPNNINSNASSETSYDIMTDVPTLTDENTANYATLNPLDTTLSYTPTDGNLKVVLTGTLPRNKVGTIAVSSGKWYWEALYSGNGGAASYRNALGVVSVDTKDTYFTSADGVTYSGVNGYSYIDGTGSAYGAATTSTGGLFAIALNLDDDEITFYIDNVSQGTITSKTFTGAYLPSFSHGSSVIQTDWEVNFGQRPFKYTPPTGFLPLNTYNLPDSTIVDGAEYMNTVLYTGDGTNDRAITGVGFQPDFTWLKARNDVADHTLFDAVRGAGSDKALYSNSTAAEGSYTAGFDAFLSDGFQVDNNVYTNSSSNTYVGWNWKANGSGVSNTDGSITSTVSANTTSGFSIATFTNVPTTSGIGHTIGHGLGTTPSMVIVKNRSISDNWYVQHASLGNTYRIQLNLSSVATTSGDIWFSTSPTSSVFTIRGSSFSASTSNTFLAYCFAPVEGFSAFGKYTGNGSSDGPFIYTGFRPAWLLVKRSDAAYSWYIHDAKRNTYNVLDKELYPDLTNAEVTATRLDFTSNGFKVRGTQVSQNASGGTYIYAAFAENPFKNSLAR